jgi:voltage-gated potassium channel
MLSIRKFFLFLRKYSIWKICTFIFGTILISSVLILKLEQGQPESQIHDYADALWWSVVGISTIGIGTIVPTSLAGKYLTVALMIIGVFIFSILTAHIAAYFTEEEVRRDLDDELNQIQGGLDKVEKDIAGEIAVEDNKIEAKVERLEEEIKSLREDKK